MQPQSMLGVDLNTLTLPTLADAALQADEKPWVFSCANPHSLVVAQTDETFRQALATSDTVVVDGVGIVLVGKLLGLKGFERITGTDFFFAVMRRLNGDRGGRIMFCGSSDAVLQRIERRMGDEFPNLEWVGGISPPFGDWPESYNDELVDRINAVQPDVLWVGMTAPKQEKWVYQHAPRLRARLIGSIGAVFDFYAGTKSRAPEWMQNAGLEWAHRLFTEPRRMWRRNVVSAPKFALLATRERLQQRHGVRA